MIVKQELLNEIKHYFGLNLYEAKIWTALLSRGVSTAGELSDIGDVPRSRAYDILEGLEKKGFVVMKLGKPIKYVAVDPSEVIERVKKNLHTDAKERAEKLDKLKSTSLITELDLLHKHGVEFIEPTDLSGAIRGRHNLYSHLDLMIRGAEQEVIMMTTMKGLIREIDALKLEFQKLSKRGVKVKIAAPIDAENLKWAQQIEKVAEIRHLEGISARFCVVDKEEILFMIMHDEDVHPTYDVGIWVNTPYFANALQTLFDIAWEDMPTLKDVTKKIEGKKK